MATRNKGSVKVPPNSMDAEQAVLAALLVDPENSWPRVMKVCLEAEDFWSPRHKLIFKGMEELHRRGQPVEIILLTECLSEMGFSDSETGGYGYLLSLLHSRSTAANVRFHSEIVEALSNRRRLIFQCETTIEALINPSTSIEEALSAHKDGLRQIESFGQEGPKTLPDLIREEYRNIERRHEADIPYVGYLTGISAIDDQMKGLEPGTVTTLAGRPSTGKSSLASNIAVNVAEKNRDKQVMYVLLESHGTLLARRSMAAYSGVFSSRLRTGSIEDHQWAPLISACDRLSSLSNLFVLEHSRFGAVENLISYLESVRMDKEIALVLIDYLQLMTSRSFRARENRNNELGVICREIQTRIAKDLNCHVLTLSQLNRQAEHRKNPRPTLADLRDSGTR